ncbi:MAG: PQQ-binding-like beta-propeller repeat protein [Opitutales bacterium]
MPHRYLLALPRGDGVYLSWRLLDSDTSDAAFTVERRGANGNWEAVSLEPLTGSTDFQDRPPADGIWAYRIRSGDTVSEDVSVDSGAEPTLAVLDVPLAVPGKSCWHLAPGDLLNDGRTGFVTSVAAEGQIHLDAYGPDGRHLWRHALGYPTTLLMDTTTPPYAVWDVNGDGRSEVVVRCQVGDRFKDEITHAAEVSPGTMSRWEGQRWAPPPRGEVLKALDGETGEEVWSAPYPGQVYESHLTLAFIDGFDQPPAIMIQDGWCYGPTHLYAVDGKDGHVRWHIRQERHTGHNLDAGDVDGDGHQEIIAGGLCWKGDGTLLWEAEPFGHTDISKPAKIDPERPGLQVYFAVEAGNPGVYCVDGPTGETIFKEPYRHAHYGWIGRHHSQTPGLHPHTAEDARAEYGDSTFMREKEHNPVFAPDGSHLQNLSEWQRKCFVPVHWDGGPNTAFVDRKTNTLHRFNDDGTNEPFEIQGLPSGARFGRNLLAYDVAGDYRENIVTIDDERDRLLVLANPTPNPRRARSPLGDLGYRHDRSQTGSGYYIYLAPPLRWV